MPTPKKGYYLKDGTRVPGVTTVLSMMKGDPGGLMYWAWNLGMQGKDFRAERDNAANVGTIAHEMIDAHIMGREAKIPTAAELSVDQDRYATMIEKARSGFDAFLNWHKNNSIKIKSAETPMVSEFYRFGGTPDAIGRADGGRLVLIDWKTSNSVHPEYIAQVAAYAKLWEENHHETPTEAILLRVGKEEGDFHVSGWPRGILDIGWTAFQRSYELYDLRKRLDKLI